MPEVWRACFRMLKKHLMGKPSFGALVGLVTAFIFKNVIEEDEEHYHASPWANENVNKHYFCQGMYLKKQNLSVILNILNLKD